MLTRTFGCVRVVWNRTLAERHRLYHAEGKSLSYAASDAALTAMKKDSDLAFLSEVSSVPLQQALRHQHKAFSAFFDKRARYPRFKSRRSRQSAHYTRSAFSMRGGELRLAKTSAPLRFVWSWPEVEVTSLNPIDRFERRISWKVRAGATRVVDGGCDGCVAGLLVVGGGPGLVSAGGTFSAALTADTELLGAPALHGISGSGVRPGIGPALLLRLLAGERAALVGTGSWRWLPLASPETTWELGAEARLHLGVVSLAARWRGAPRAHEVGLLLLLYRD